MQLSRFRLLRREWLIVGFMGVLAAGVLYAVVSLHERADRSRQAQVRLADVKTATQQIVSVPLTALYESPLLGTQALATATARINGDLASLQGLAPSPKLKLIGNSARVFSDNVKSIVTLISTLKALGAKQIGSMPDPTSVAGSSGIQKRFQRDENGINALINSASSGYEQAARTANMEAYLGSAAVILFAFFGFVAVLRGLARARRESETARKHAENLVVENMQLLKASRVEANTDQLTGLANRRRLMADLDAATETLAPGERVLLALYDLDGFKQYNDSFGHPAGDALLARLGQRLHETTTSKGVAYRMGGDEFCTVCHLAEGEDAPTLVEVGRAALTEHGEAFHVSASYGTALLPLEAEHAEEALRLADQRLYAHKSFSPLRGTSLARNMLLQTLKERSSSLGTHLSRVAQLSEQLARHLRLPAIEVDQIRLAAELHDIGKVAIPDAILNKPDNLTNNEWTLIKQHTLIGERIIAAAGSALEDVALIVRSSHERADGSGYPDGLTGDDIPLGARIIAICDAYDAMLAPRTYNPPLDKNQALHELERCAGTQFDPKLVTVFVELVRSGTYDKRAAA